MIGKVCLVTGATAGLGAATAEALARVGATVVVVGRNPEKCAGTVERIRNTTGNPRVDHLAADLTSQCEVRQVARQFQERHGRLDVLINNAGAIFMRRRLSADGIEMTFALNHLAPFLLTNLLLDTLRDSAPARVINISSMGHRRAQALDLTDPGFRGTYRGLPCYARSKLANLLFTYELARRLDGTGVTANAFDPGLVATDIGKNNGGPWMLLKALFDRLYKLNYRSAEEAARGVAHLAASPELEGMSGRYFDESGPVDSSDASRDTVAAERLWRTSEAWTSGAQVTRTRMSLIEELTHRSDRPDKPMNMQAEIRFSGSLDPARLRGAIQSALVVHPMTRARLIRNVNLLRRPEWEIREERSRDVLSTTQCQSESEMDGIRAELYNQPIGLDEPPALRVMLVHRVRGDALLLSINHTITDGAGALRFLHSIARAYRGVSDRPPDVDVLAVRDLRTQFGRPDMPRPRAIAHSGPRAFLVAEAAPGLSGYGFCHQALSAEQRSRLDPQRFGPSVTLNDLLLGAMHQAIEEWNRERGVPSGVINVFVPSSLRPPAWYNEVVANLTLGGKVGTAPNQRASAVSLMEAVTEQTQVIKEGGGLARLLDAPGWLFNLLPIALPATCALLGNRARSSAVVTYFGKLDREVPDFGPDAGEVTEVWGSPPVGMPPGVSLGACVYRGKLYLSLRYRRTLFGEDSARAFFNLLIKRLIVLGEGADPPVLEAVNRPAVHV